jgi:pyridoxal phosphate enzyme (YggS family)
VPATPPSAEQRDAATVGERWHDLVERVGFAARDAGRRPDEVRILLASKTMPVDVVREAVRAGARLLGENRVQELTGKAPELIGLGPEIHLIGHLQSNKVAAALPWVTCVQSVDALDLAQRLSRRCAASGRDLDVMVQVNVSGEPTKHGVAPDDALELAIGVARLPHLRLTGLMTIGARSLDERVVRRGFARLRAVRDEVLGSGAEGTADARELSMGMSGDLEPAIAEGATIVRVGTAVFGPRPPAAKP